MDSMWKHFCQWAKDVVYVPIGMKCPYCKKSENNT